MERIKEKEASGLMAIELIRQQVKKENTVRSNLKNTCAQIFLVFINYINMDYIYHYNSPLGSITLASSGESLTGLYYTKHRR